MAEATIYVRGTDIDPKSFSANQIYNRYKEKGGIKSFADFMEIANQIGLVQMIGAGDRELEIEKIVAKEQETKILGMSPFVAAGALVVTIGLVATLIVVATRKGKK